MQSQLIRYMKAYLKGVQIVGEKHLASKGLAVEALIAYISQQNNRGDELSLYLLARMIQKHLCVIGKNSVWYTSYCKDQEITVADCHIVLVYLGARTVRDTKLVAAAAKGCPKSNPKLPLSSGEEYSPSFTPVYDPAMKKQCMRSMGLISTDKSSSSSADAESDSPLPEVTPDSSPQPSDTDPEPENVPPTPSKPARGWPRKPKARVVKEKTYKMRQGQCTTWRHCTLCQKRFLSQDELNHHTVEDHKYKFLCSQWPCKKVFTSKSALDKHSLHHKAAIYTCPTCSKEFYHKYQLNSHINVCDLDKVFPCTYP